MNYEENVKRYYEEEISHEKSQGGCSFEGYEEAFIREGVAPHNAAQMASLVTNADIADAQLRAVMHAVLDEMKWSRGRPRPPAYRVDPRVLKARYEEDISDLAVKAFEYEIGYIAGNKSKEERGRLAEGAQAEIKALEKKIEELE